MTESVGKRWESDQIFGRHALRLVIFLVPAGIGNRKGSLPEKTSSRSDNTEIMGADSGALFRLATPILRFGRSFTGTTAKSLR